MAILAQTFFTLVGSHLVAFSFLSAWHIDEYLKSYTKGEYHEEAFAALYLFHIFHEHFGRLESRDLVFGDYDSGIFRDIACSLL